MALNSRTEHSEMFTMRDADPQYQIPHKNGNGLKDLTEFMLQLKVNQLRDCTY